MTVQELIDKLKECNPDARVEVPNVRARDGSYGGDVTGVVDLVSWVSIEWV